MALEVGSKIAHYDVTALIGEGGMGHILLPVGRESERGCGGSILTSPGRRSRGRPEMCGPVASLFIRKLRLLTDSTAARSDSSARRQ